jgi:RNA polymerase-binding transcription factor DksA
MAVSKRFCERCRKEIPAGRLAALPHTIVCLKCSEAIGSEHVLVTTAERGGKKESFKKNYVSYDVRLRRRPIRRLENQE